MFQIDEFTKATLATLTPRNEKHGDDDKPALSLGLEMRVPNTLLDLIDPELRGTLYKASDSKPLPGVTEAMTAVRCNSIESAKVSKRYDGWTLEVDDGAEESAASTFGGCKVDKLSVEPMAGGSCALRLRVGTSDLDAERSGMLSMHIGQSIWVRLIAPRPGEQKESSEAGGNEPDATDMFVEQHGKSKSATKAKTPAKSRAKREHAEAKSGKR